MKNDTFICTFKPTTTTTTTTTIIIIIIIIIITVIDTIADSYLASTSTIAGGAAEIAAARSVTKTTYWLGPTSFVQLHLRPWGQSMKPGRNFCLN